MARPLARGSVMSCTHTDSVAEMAPSLFSCPTLLPSPLPPPPQAFMATIADDAGLSEACNASLHLGVGS